MGLAQRFPIDPKEKWKKQCAIYNQAGVEGLKPLDSKNDPVPGPGYYKVTEVWKGKQVKAPKKARGKKKRPFSANPQVGERILKNISKGPCISIYHRK